MKTLGNILWFIFGGFALWLEWVFAGILLCITVIGLPAGIQCFKIAGLCALPFKKEIVHEPAAFGNTFFNILWIIVFGWEIALTAQSGVVGAVSAVTCILRKEDGGLGVVFRDPVGGRLSLVVGMHR
ncbi:MAG: hypothetical protein IJE28_10370, partial [Oscillospiraceae bacterium]|nr:hypothetical protein [Oscillospiraceae bacterium]